MVEDGETAAALCLHSQHQHDPQSVGIDFIKCLWYLFLRVCVCGCLFLLLCHNVLNYYVPQCVHVRVDVFV